jgi:hypothetical protein
MAPGGVLQRDACEIYDRIDAVGEAAADLLVNTEDNAMTGRIDKPCSQNISNAARQYEIVVPFRCFVTAGPEDTRRAFSSYH